LAQSVLKVETSFKTIIEIPFENIINIGEKIVVSL